MQFVFIEEGEVNNWRNAGRAVAALMLVSLVGASTQAPATPQRRALPGDLTKPVGQYTGNEFFTLVNGLNYTGGQERARRCSGAAGCNGTTRTNVRIDAVATEDSVAAGTINQFGVVLARLVVRGNQTEAMYGMLPTGAGNRYSYYLIVTRDAAGAMRWRLEQLSVQGNTRTHTLLREGRFNPCPGHPFVRGARADFRSCAQAAAAPASFGLALQGVDPPIWTSCAAGCCIAEGGPGT